MKKSLILLAVAVAFSSSSAFAGYKSAGCGLGALVFKDNNEWWAQTLAATTNGTSGNQTFGITTGTLECDANALISQMDKTKVFVEANKNAVSNDIARGEGETLTVISKIMNCQDSAAFSSALQKEYGTIFTGEQDSAESVTLRIFSVIDQSKGCQPLS